MPPFYRLVARTGWTLAVLGWVLFAGTLAWHTVFCIA